MAHAKNDVRSPQWWRHLRDWKRVYWKKVRKQVRNEKTGL